MSTPTEQQGCAAPALAALVGAYCFGDLTNAQRERLELHLLECDACWAEVRSLARSVEALRSDASLQSAVTAHEIVPMLGLSGRINRPFGGHAWYAASASAVYALLFAVPVLVEIAYEFDRYGDSALRMAPYVWLYTFLTALATLWLDARRIVSGKPAFRTVLLVQGIATILVCAVLLPFLPHAPTVEATFQTYPAHLGYLKSVFYAWLVGPLFLFWTFHFVVALQRELVEGRAPVVLSLLSGDPSGLPPRGTVYVKPVLLIAYLAGLFVFNYAGVNHLFGNLDPAPYRNLFMTTVLLRVTVWLGLAALGTWWYASALVELKREAVALGASRRSTNQDGLARDWKD